MKFADAKGREYECRVTLQTAINLKSQADFNLNDIGKTDLLERLTNDPELLVNVLWVIVEKSAKANQVDQEEFAASLGGDTLAAAVDAMMDSIVSFFQPSRRTALKMMLDKGREVESLAGQQLRAAMEKTTPEMILIALNSAGNKGALPESIPAI